MIIDAYLSVLSKLPVVWLILLAAASVIFGDYSAKTWSVNHETVWLLLAFVGYFFSAFFYIPTLLREGLVVTSVLWGLLSTVGFIIIGILIFQETLSVLQTVAVVLGAAVIVVLTVF